MKCSKCGTEYEGESCPKCNGPEILINKSDYIRRKKEYEETGMVTGLKMKKQEEETQKPEEEEQFALPQIKIPNLKLSKEKFADLGRGKEKLKENRVLKFVRMHWIQLTILLVVLMIAGFAGTKIYKLIKRESMTLYTTSEARIYTAGNLETTFVNNLSEVVFTVDQKKFYQTTIPDEVKENAMVDSCASDDGKYFAAVTFGDDEVYRLYMWNAEGVKLISQSAAQKSIKYITDKGKLLYAEMNYSYEEVVDNITLMVFDCSNDKNLDKGVSTTIATNVRSEYLYLKNNTLVFLDTANKLYTMNFDKMNDKKQLFENVKEVYGISEENSVVYQNSTEMVKNEHTDEAFIYSQNSKFYYYNVSDQTSVYLMTSNMSGVDMVYEKKADYIYCTIANNIYYGKIGDNGVTSLEKLDMISNVSDKCYISSSSILVYVNKNGDLISVSKGETTVIRGGVQSGTLNLVKNADGGITYVADEKQYYRASLTASEVKLQDVTDALDTSGTLLHKGNLYFLSSKNELCSCTTKGKDFNTLGTVETFWVY